mmetsp:Transcript_24698/g.51477  ORF Transcript_24698/g.51477 Transcript_24698/m.51477 type:complete len:88 (+) Transcript_24698:958-1221(+)
MTRWLLLVILGTVIQLLISERGWVGNVFDKIESKDSLTRHVVLDIFAAVAFAVYAALVCALTLTISLNVAMLCSAESLILTPQIQRR